MAEKRSARRRRLAALGTLLALTLGACGFAAPGGVAPGQVVLYGDSLADESSAFFAMQLAGRASVRSLTFPGVALCDFYDDVVADTLRARPKAAVLVFSGNVGTPCSAGLSREGAAARYASEAEALTAFLAARGVPLFWVTAPRGRPPGPGAPARNDQFDTVEPFTSQIYRDLVSRWRAAGHDVSLIDAAPALLNPDGSWADRLPCLPVDAPGCAGGTVSVRGPDGVHFCPTGWVNVDGGCAVWSGGAWRYARAMSDSVRGRFGLG